MGKIPCYQVVSSPLWNVNNWQNPPVQKNQRMRQYSVNTLAINKKPQTKQKYRYHHQKRLQGNVSFPCSWTEPSGSLVSVTVSFHSWWLCIRGMTYSTFPQGHFLSFRSGRSLSCVNSGGLELNPSVCFFRLTAPNRKQLYLHIVCDIVLWWTDTFQWKQSFGVKFEWLRAFASL